MATLYYGSYYQLSINSRQRLPKPPLRAPVIGLSGFELPDEDPPMPGMGREDKRLESGLDDELLPDPGSDGAFQQIVNPLVLEASTET